MAKQPHILLETGDIHPTVLVPGDPDRVARIAGHCRDVEALTDNREYTVVNARYEGTPLTICSTGVGSPSTAVAIEELAAIGAERFIRVGTTGGLQPGIRTGDLVIATGAAKDEGTTKRYEAATIPAVPDHRVLAALVHAAHDGPRPVHVGPIVTDDAFYAETEEYVAAWEDAGLVAVEMEAAAIFTLARRRGLAAGAILTVDGNLVEGTKKGETEDDEELPDAADEAIDAAIAIALEATGELSG